MFMWILLSACDAPPTRSQDPGLLRRLEAPWGVVALDDVQGFGDVNGDGHIDLGLPEGVALGDGSGGFTVVRPPPLDPVDWLFCQGAWTTDWTIADGDGDGISDWFGTLYYSEFEDYYPECSAITIATGSADGLSSRRGWGWHEVGWPTFRLGDVNADGMDELAQVRGEAPDEVTDILNLTPGSLARVSARGGVGGAGDVNGDGLDDLLGWTHDRAVAVQLSAPGVALPTHTDGEWTWSWRWPTAPLPGEERMAFLRHGEQVRPVGDLNGDGVGDLATVVISGTQRIAWFAGGMPLPDEPTGWFELSPSDSLLDTRLTGADLDGDGVTELVATATVDGQLVLAEFVAGQVHPRRVATLPVLHGSPSLEYPGDVNGDGLGDLIIHRKLLLGTALECPGGAPGRWSVDADGDGFASDAHVVEACEPPPGASATPGSDCDDSDPQVWPGALEIEGGVDANCDGWIVCNEDLDDDQFGGQPIDANAFRCDPSYAIGWFDCDDSNPEIPDLSQRDAVGSTDWDCDGYITCYEDYDEDGLGGYGLERTTASSCDNPTMRVAPAHEDCDDRDGLGLRRVRGYFDSDGDGYVEDFLRYGCEGEELPQPAPEDADCVDWDPAIGPPRSFLDWDGDGWGDDSEPPRCQGVPVGGDCDDRDPSVGPPVGFRDEDGDGWGDAASPLVCRGALRSGDCNDLRADVNPGEPPGVGHDYDCDGAVSCWADADGDGVAGSVAPEGGPTCVSSVPRRPAPWDCDDASTTVAPGLPEDPADSVDNNCNGRTRPFLLFERFADGRWRFGGGDFPALETIGLAWSDEGIGPGPCPSGSTQCFDILRPHHVSWTTTDTAGQLVDTVRIPLLRSAPAWFQALGPTSRSEVVVVR